MDALIDDSWPLKDIPDGMLLAIYLNPACASLAMLDHTITASGENLRDGAKKLAVEAQVLLKVEGKERSGSGHQSNQLILNTLPFFKLNAQFAVETYNLQVTQNPEAFARHRDTPQTF